MYDKIDTMATKPEEIVTKMKAHEVRLQQEDGLEVAAMFSMLQTKSNKRRQARKSWKTGGCASERNGSSLDNEQRASRLINWRDTQECYRGHKKEHIEQYCPSTAPVGSTVPTETAAVTITSIGNY